MLFVNQPYGAFLVYTHTLSSPICFPHPAASATLGDMNNVVILLSAVRMERQYGSLVVKRRRRRRQSLDITKECCQCRTRVKKAKKISPKRDTRFADLPEEIILNIVSYLSLKDVLSISQVPGCLES